MKKRIFLKGPPGAEVILNRIGVYTDDNLDAQNFDELIQFIENATKKVEAILKSIKAKHICKKRGLYYNTLKDI